MEKKMIFVLKTPSCPTGQHSSVFSVVIFFSLVIWGQALSGYAAIGRSGDVLGLAVLKMIVKGKDSDHP
jgi:hypothetical protein